MKKWIRITAIFSTLLLMLVGNSYVLNAKSIENDDVSITITVAQDQDNIDITGTISNQGDEQITNGTLEITNPNERKLKGGNLMVEDLVLDTHRSYQTEVIVKKEDEPSQSIIMIIPFFLSLFDIVHTFGSFDLIGVSFAISFVLSFDI